ncbi:hypothetical protein SAMN05192529_11016 [Arachidicoccus rhizosphaerae]|uniref:YD repeat-containing protein n=1 Tax=Arachidicoccus rhizosphaerae TaxID=551991 RepID=A0A1H3Z4M2_9BACT|nr:hypothetical protein SAMN05192529_11016 [Arachidicoccus rhizosphaerae]
MPGFDLGYDNKTNSLINNQAYTSARYDGNITGTVWKTVQDNKVCKYDYTYDNVGRLTGAGFNQYTGISFNKTAGVDYSVSSLNYDLNGNIKTMTQKRATQFGDLKYY